MNQKREILDLLKMYSVLVGQQEDVLTTIAQLRKMDPHQNFDKKETFIMDMIAEFTAKVRRLQDEVEGKVG